MTPVYFENIPSGGSFEFNGNTWVKVIPSKSWTIGRDVTDKLANTGANAICPEPTNSEEMLVNYFESKSIVEVY